MGRFYTLSEPQPPYPTHFAMANTAGDTVTSEANKEEEVSNSSDESVSNFFSNDLVFVNHYKSNSIRIVLVRG